MHERPAGFEPLFRTSPFSDLLGPIFNKSTAAGLLIGIRVQEKHCNTRGIVHGGVLSSLADMALGYNLALAEGEPIPMVTVSLTIDYAGSAKLGDWITAETDVQKVGRHMAFANCYLFVDGKRIARGSGVFKVLEV